MTFCVVWALAVFGGWDCVLGNYKEINPVTLDPNAPGLPANAREIDKLGFAAASLWWARGNHPPKSFQEDKDRKLAPVEWQLIEALEVLDSVPDSDDDNAAKDQREQRQYAAWNAIKKGIASLDVGAAEKDILKTILAPTIAGDGQGPTRDALRGWIVSLLYDYRAKSGDTNPSLSILDRLKASFSLVPDVPALNAGRSLVEYSAAFRAAEKVRQEIKAHIELTDSVRAKMTTYTSQQKTDPNPRRLGGAPPSSGRTGDSGMSKVWFCLTCSGGDGLRLWMEPRN